MSNRVSPRHSGVSIGIFTNVSRVEHSYCEWLSSVHLVGSENVCSLGTTKTVLQDFVWKRTLSCHQSKTSLYVFLQIPLPTTSQTINRWGKSPSSQKRRTEKFAGVLGLCQTLKLVTYLKSIVVWVPDPVVWRWSREQSLPESVSRRSPPHISDSPPNHGTDRRPPHPNQFSSSWTIYLYVTIHVCTRLIRFYIH